MKALVYHGPGHIAWEDASDPLVIDPTDAIVRVEATTICGTDLHIVKGDVPAVTDGRILATKRSAPSHRSEPPYDASLSATASSFRASLRAARAASAAMVTPANALAAAAGSSAI